MRQQLFAVGNRFPLTLDLFLSPFISYPATDRQINMTESVMLNRLAKMSWYLFTDENAPPDNRVNIPTF